jgi:hypothetical protein
MSVHALTAGLFVATCVAVSAQSLNAPPRTARQSSPSSAEQALNVFRARLIEEQVKSPYSKLFRAPIGNSAAGHEDRNHLPARRPTEKQICGLTVWNVEPDLDPRTIIRPPDPRREFFITKIQPTVCAQ